MVPPAERVTDFIIKARIVRELIEEFEEPSFRKFSNVAAAGVAQYGTGQPALCIRLRHRDGYRAAHLSPARLANKDIVHHIEHAHTDVLRCWREPWRGLQCGAGIRKPLLQRLFMVTRLNS